MTRTPSFGYRSGNTSLHRLDVRVKLIAMIMLSLLSTQVPLIRLMAMTGFFLWIFSFTGISFLSVIRDMRLFFLLLLMIFMVRIHTETGIPDFAWGPYAIGFDGLVSGALVCFRLFFILLLGLILIATTKPHEIKSGMAWFLIPFPFIPRKRVATMIGLLIRFIPVILAEASDIVDAQRARGIEARKNPLFRIIKLVVPLAQRTFLRADKLVLAMEARCYRETRTDPSLTFGIKDGLILIMLFGLSMFLLVV